MLSLINISQLLSFHLDYCCIFLYAVLKVIFHTYSFPLFCDLFILFQSQCMPLFSQLPPFLPPFTNIYSHILSHPFILQGASGCSKTSMLSTQHSCSELCNSNTAISIWLVLMDSCICCSTVRCTAVDKKVSD